MTKPISSMNLEEYKHYYTTSAPDYPYLDNFDQNGPHWHRTQFYKKYLKNSQKVLDVACSTGGLAKYITENYDLTLFAFDVAPFFAEQAQKHAPKALCASFAIEEMCFVDNVFDVVIAGEVLEHVLDFKKVMDQLKRVVKPGGFLLTTTPSTHDSLDNDQHLRMVDPHLLEQHLPNVRVEYNKYSWLSAWQK